MKKVLAVFAHPDDESFGPGGALAIWARNGINIKLVCVTCGESGNNHTGEKTAILRKKELRKAAEILGIKTVEFLGFPDGRLANCDLPALEKSIGAEIKKFKPDAVLTFDLNGLSGHLDHIAVSSAATLAFLKTKIARKIYYCVKTKEFTDQVHRDWDYFIYFPDGRKPEEISETINVSAVWNKKIAAMKCHRSQAGDLKRVLSIQSRMPKEEHFIVRKLNQQPFF